MAKQVVTRTYTASIRNHSRVQDDLDRLFNETDSEKVSKRLTFVSTSVAGVKRTQFIAVDNIGQQFKKRYFDERLG